MKALDLFWLIRLGCTWTISHWGRTSKSLYEEPLDLGLPELSVPPEVPEVLCLKKLLELGFT